MRRFLLVASVLSAVSAFAADRETKLVTRVDNVTVSKKGDTLAINVEGKGTTPGLSAGPAKLVRHENATAPNTEGLLEYDMLYEGARGYTGFKMRTVRASLKDRNVPAEVKGVRIFYEFGKYDAVIPVKQPRPKS